MIKGIDVSSHQDRVDWTLVKADGVAFAYIKATEGVGFVDPKLGAFVAGAEAAAIPPQAGRRRGRASRMRRRRGWRWSGSPTRRRSRSHGCRPGSRPRRHSENWGTSMRPSSPRSSARSGRRLRPVQARPQTDREEPMTRSDSNWSRPRNLETLTDRRRPWESWSPFRQTATATHSDTSSANHCLSRTTQRAARSAEAAHDVSGSLERVHTRTKRHSSKALKRRFWLMSFKPSSRL